MLIFQKGKEAFMNKTNNTKNSETTNSTIENVAEEINRQVIDISNKEEVKYHVLKVLDSQFGKDVLKNAGAERIETLANDVTEMFQFNALAEHTGDCFSRRTLAAVKNPRWYADKVSGSIIDIGVKALVVGGGYMAYQAYRNRKTDAVPSASDVSESPFSNSNGFAASPRPLRSAKRAESSVASIS